MAQRGLSSADDGSPLGSHDWTSTFVAKLPDRSRRTGWLSGWPEVVRRSSRDRHLGVPVDPASVVACPAENASHTSSEQPAWLSFSRFHRMAG
jgi:hypothetical protein